MFLFILLLMNICIVLLFKPHCYKCMHKNFSGYRLHHRLPSHSTCASSSLLSDMKLLSKYLYELTLSPVMNQGPGRFTSSTTLHISRLSKCYQSDHQKLDFNLHFQRLSLCISVLPTRCSYHMILKCRKRVYLSLVTAARSRVASTQGQLTLVE